MLTFFTNPIAVMLVVNVLAWAYALLIFGVAALNGYGGNWRHLRYAAIIAFALLVVACRLVYAYAH